MTRFPEDHPLQPPLAMIVRQACVHSFIAIVLVFMGAMLWAAAFGDIPGSAKTFPRCEQYDLGPTASAGRLDR